jgi:ABC-type polysaccharide/polyol phosphate transport system ATPase subunit
VLLFEDFGLIHSNLNGKNSLLAIVWRIAKIQYGYTTPIHRIHAVILTYWGLSSNTRGNGNESFGIR